MIFRRGLLLGCNGGLIKNNVVDFKDACPSCKGFAYNTGPSSYIKMVANTSYYAHTGLNADTGDCIYLTCDNNNFYNNYKYGIRMNCVHQLGEIKNNFISMFGDDEIGGIIQERYNVFNFNILNNTVVSSNSKGYGIILYTQHSGQTISGNVLKQVNSNELILTSSGDYSSTGQLKNRITPGSHSEGNTYNGVVGATGCNNANGFLGCSCMPSSNSNLVWLKGLTVDTGLLWGGNTSSGQPINTALSYSDFTNSWMFAFVSAISSHTINFYPSSTTGANDYRVWIDFNHDEDFDDAGEEVVALNNVVANASGFVPGTFLIPTSALNYYTRMRVKIRQTGSSTTSDTTACESAFNGETEDYTLVVYDATYSSAETYSSIGGEGAQQTTSIEKQKNAGGIDIYPNPTTGNIIVELDGNSFASNTTILVYNFLGEVVAKVGENAVSNRNKIDLSNEAEGTYFVRVFSEKEVINKKVVLVKI